MIQVSFIIASLLRWILSLSSTLPLISISSGWYTYMYTQRLYMFCLYLFKLTMSRFFYIYIYSDYLYLHIQAISFPSNPFLCFLRVSVFLLPPAAPPLLCEAPPGRSDAQGGVFPWGYRPRCPLPHTGCGLRLHRASCWGKCFCLIPFSSHSLLLLFILESLKPPHTHFPHLMPLWWWWKPFWNLAFTSLLLGDWKFWNVLCPSDSNGGTLLMLLYDCRVFLGRRVKRLIQVMTLIPWTQYSPIPSA